MKKPEKVGEINDVNCFAFNCYRFVYRFNFYYAFDRLRQQVIKIFQKPLTNRAFCVILYLNEGGIRCQVAELLLKDL